MVFSGRLSSQTVLVIPLAALLIVYTWLQKTSPVAGLEAQLRDPGRFGYPEWYRKAVDGSGDESEHEAVNKGPISALIVFDSQTASPGQLTIIDRLMAQPPSNINTTLYDSSWPNKALRTQTDEGECMFESVWLLGDASLESMSRPNACLTRSILRQPTLSPPPSQNPLLPLQASGITLLDTPSHAHLDTLLIEAYREDPPTTKWIGGSSDGGQGSVKRLGLYGHLAPAADSQLFRPRQRGWFRWPKSLEWIRGGKGRRITLIRSGGKNSRKDQWHRPWGWSEHTIKEMPRTTRSYFWPLVGSHPTPLPTILNRHRKQQVKLAKVLGRSDVCVFEGSGGDGWDGSLLTESVVQAMMSGCVVAGVVPNLHRQALEDIYLTIPPSPYPVSQNTSYLSTELNHLLRTLPDANGDIARKSLLGVILARAELGWDTRWKMVERLIKGYEMGKRGFEFPHGYAIDCDHASGWKAAWCPGASKSAEPGFWYRWRPF